jgi:hypothetical protein
MKSISWILITIFMLGLIILILPDEGDPVFRLNKTHGPSLPDLVGLIFMLASWLISCVIIISRWQLVTQRAGKRSVYLSVTIYFLFLAGIVAALLLSFEWMLWVCVVTASMINIFFILLAFRVKSPR